MKELEQKRLKELLRQTMPPVAPDAEPTRNLWPGMLQRIDAETATSGWRLPWYDGALLAGLVGLGAVFPAAIPVFLYYL